LPFQRVKGDGQEELPLGRHCARPRGSRPRAAASRSAGSPVNQENS
jgi:hypothetical protein